MARPTIEDIRGLGNMIQSNFWELEVIKPPKAVNISADAFNFRCTTVDTPKKTGNSMSVNIRGLKVRQIGDWDYTGTITVNLVETIDTEMLSLIRELREVSSETGTNRTSLKSDIEMGLGLYRLDVDNNRIWKYELIGVQIEDYDPGTFTDTGDIVNVSITFGYDYFIDGAV